MSGINIPGLAMPTSPVLFCIHPDGKVFADLEGGWREYQAITVTDHGDLVDLNEAADAVCCYDGDAWLDTKQIHIVIPADKEGE